MRTTISEMGPQLLSRLMGLNEVQSGVMDIVFRVADDRGLLLLDLKDLRAMLAHVSQNAAEYAKSYGSVSAASVGAIQRALLSLENEGAEKFFGEPAFEIEDLFAVEGGKGVTFIPELALDQLTPQQKALVRPFALPIPTREIVFLTSRSFVRHSVRTLLCEAIRASVPRRMLKLNNSEQRI